MKALLILLVFLFLATSQPSAKIAYVNWTHTNSNALGTNFIKQGVITGGNINKLDLLWSSPFPTSAPPKGLNFTGEGAIAPPLVVNGVVYVVMNDLHVLAIRVNDGARLWTYQPILNRTGLPLGILAGHVHGLTYHAGAIWLSLPDCSALALDPQDGSPELRIARICADIPGNSGRYDYSGAPIAFDGDIMFWTASSVSEGTDAGRGFVAAYNTSGGNLLWRWFVVPPSGGDPNWDSNTCNLPCHGNIAAFVGDWGTLGSTSKPSLAGAGPSWGQPAVDETDGLLILGTSQPSPDWNATYRPGPNLYSSSIVALNVTSGRLVWFYQTTPHDLYDFDCGWNVALGSSTRDGINRTTVFKACKNGYVYAIDAKSGNLLWKYSPSTIVRLNTANADYAFSGAYNATERWTPSKATSIEQCPGVNGGVESDISVAYGKVFVATHNFCSFLTRGPVGNFGATVSGATEIAFDFAHANTTIYAVNASTGKAAWSYFLPSIAYRGWLTSTGDMVLASTLDGRIIALDARSGALDGSTMVGGSLYEGVTLGSDCSGRIVLFQLTSSSAYGGFASGTPGALLAFVPRHSQIESQTILILLFTGAIAIAFGVLAYGVIFRSQREIDSGLSRMTYSM